MLQRGRGPGLMTALFVGSAVMAGCSDSAVGPSAPSAVKFPTTVVSTVVNPDVCQNITFEGLAHGTTVTNQLSVFGSTLTVSNVLANSSTGSTVTSQAKIYAGTHVGGPDFDLEGTANGGLCDNCTSNMLVIQEQFNAGEGGATSDNTWGGTLTITGFPANTYIESFQLADHEATEADARLIVAGTNVAPVGQPDGVNHVQTFATTSQPTITGAGIQFLFGNPPTQQGSEAIDNIRVCQRQALGADGCTPGYWKNHTDSWGPTGYSPSQTVGSVFSGASAFPSLASQTLLAGLNGGGGPGTLGAATILIRAGIAGLLNAAHPGVDYAQTSAQIIAAVNAALASNNRDTMLALATTIDTQNNAGCPLN